MTSQFQLCFFLNFFFFSFLACTYPVIILMLAIFKIIFPLSVFHLHWYASCRSHHYCHSAFSFWFLFLFWNSVLILVIPKFLYVLICLLTLLLHSSFNSDSHSHSDCYTIYTMLVFIRYSCFNLSLTFLPSVLFSLWLPCSSSSCSFYITVFLNSFPF